MEALGQNNLWVKQYICLFIALVFEVFFMLPGIYLLTNMTNFNTAIEYFTPVSFVQPGCAGLCIVGCSWSKFVNISSGLSNVSKFLEKQTSSFEMKILKKAHKYKLISIVIQTVSVCSHLLYLPSLIDDGFEALTYYTAKSFFGAGNFITISFFFPCLIAGSLGMMQPILFMIHFTFHIQFQLMWLSEYVKENLHRKLNMKNGRDQELVYGHLVNVVKYRLCFKTAFDTIKTVQKLSIFLLSMSGAMAAVMCIYNIRNKTHQSESFKLYSTVAVIISNVILMGVCGQLISDESIKLRNVLYESPWFNWNIKNRKVLLMIITNIEDPWEISFYGIVPINHQFITKGAKLAYSIAAVLSKMK